MSIDDFSGYKWLPEHYDITRWQHRLFAEIRTAPIYKRLLGHARKVWEASGREGAPPETFREGFWYGNEVDRAAPYFQALEQAVRDLRLTHKGIPCPWAICYLHDDVVGHFNADQSPWMWMIPRERVIEISISSLGTTVETYDGWDRYDVETTTNTDGTETTTSWYSNIVRSDYVQHERPMMIGKAEWDELECLAVTAAQQAVADLRSSYEQPADDSPFFTTTRIKAGYESDHVLQIERLALRILNRPGTRNTAAIDRGWRDRLSVDLPPKQ